ncbi:hypothetical protein [Helicobacter mehlei]|uniref:CMP-N-acetylneuraminic acid synthetase n=1 Tax=Helicobacter mehlei TaxID=2316080 RepID=A0A553UMI2_9HELI|nr:hypothetical protein [Helicobacter mehlei]TSA81419.1 hypothetical protein FNE76_06675 [Helicobacter mehlei]
MIKILCDASLTSGLGHLRRCQKLQNLLASLDLKTYLFAPHPLADEPLNWLKTSPLNVGDCVIIDSYLAPPSFYEHLNASQVLVIEDAPHTYPKDFYVLNPSFLAHTLYTNPTPKHFLGIEFMPYEPAFNTPKNLKSSISNLFLSFGGSQHALPFYTQALKILEQPPLSVQVIAPPNLAPILQANHPPNSKRTYHVGLSLAEIATCMHQSDVALLGAGGMLYEAILAHTPILSIPLASNQLPQWQALSGQGVCWASSWDHLLIDLQNLSLEARMCMWHAQERLKVGTKLLDTLKEIFHVSI